MRRPLLLVLALTGACVESDEFTPHQEDDEDAAPNDPGAACNLDLDTPVEAVATVEGFAAEVDPESGVYEGGTVWTKPQLSVCFTTSLHATERGWIRHAVENSWEAVAGIDFVGWGRCIGPGYSDISIELLAEGGGGWSRFGTLSASTYPSMKLSASFESSSCGTTSTCLDENVKPNGKTGRQNCVEGIALHEFGHALGLRHSQAHPDSTCFHDEDLDGPHDDHDGRPLWSYDPASIMNYCNSQIFTDPHLSAGDIRTVTSMYPRQVTAFTETDFAGDSIVVGPGTFIDCAGDFEPIDGSEIRSLAVPPGFVVRACPPGVSWGCPTYYGISGNLPASVSGNVDRMFVDTYVPVYDRAGFTGPTYQNLFPGKYLANSWGFWAVGNDAISSMIVPPTMDARLCMHEGTGDGGEPCELQDGLDAMREVLPEPMNNDASFAEIRRKVVAYTQPGFRGLGSSFDLGTYRRSIGTLDLTNVKSLAIPRGLRARICDADTGGTCQTYTRSTPASALASVQRLEVSTQPYTASPLCLEP